MDFFIVLAVIIIITTIFQLLSQIKVVQYSLNEIRKELALLRAAAVTTENKQQDLNKQPVVTKSVSEEAKAEPKNTNTNNNQIQEFRPWLLKEEPTTSEQPVSSDKTPKKPIKPIELTEPIQPSFSVTAKTEKESSITAQGLNKKQPKQAQQQSVNPTKAKIKAKAPVIPHQPSWLEKGLKKAWDWLTGGNSVARVGVLVLFFGVAFLLKYAADNDMLPAEIRLAAAAIGGLVLLVLGWRLKDKNRDYGLLLQGAGVGMLYLTAFTSYYLYHFISTGFAFGLLVLICALATALAVLQNAAILAIAGFIGGYLTPIMISTGTNNYIALFSYYALLNTAVATIAWFKSWRLLNLIAFGFTFIISTTWGVLSYLPENFNNTEPFLIIFFLQFLVIAVLFALRQPPNLKGYIDGSLIFGTPIIAFSLQLKLVQPFEYGAAISSFVMGCIYVALATMIYKRSQSSLRLLAEVFVAIGVIFLSLAIPFAVDPDITAATWALEGAGLYWIGMRQQRVLVRIFALLLQVGAAIAFSQHDVASSEGIAFLNSWFIGVAMIAGSGIMLAWLSSQDFKGKKPTEAKLSSLLFAWAMLWWLLAGIRQVDQYFTLLERANILLAFFTSTAIIMLLLTRKLQWNYSRIMSLAFIPTMGICALSVASASLHPSYHWGWLIWIVAFSVSTWVLWEADQHANTDSESQQITGLSLLHNFTLLGFMLILTWEGSWQITQHVDFYNGWHMAWLPIVTIALLWTIMRVRIWPFTHHRDSYSNISGIMLAMTLVAWNLFSVYSTGNSTPLPWIPVLNVMDLVQIASIITLFIGWNYYKQKQKITDLLLIQAWDRGLIALAFLWLNVMIMRTVHHWVGIPYQLITLLKSPIVQTTFSVLWTMTGVILMLFAVRKQWKQLWLVGVSLIAVVVIKLLLVDLAASGTVERIISFIMVGVLMVAIGYFAPMPSEKESDEVRLFDTKELPIKVE